MIFVSVSCEKLKVNRQVNDKEDKGEGIHYDNSISAKAKNNRKKTNFRSLDIEENVLPINYSKAMFKRTSRIFGDSTNFNARTEFNKRWWKLNQILSGKSKKSVENYTSSSSQRNVTGKSGPNQKYGSILVFNNDDSPKTRKQESDNSESSRKHHTQNSTRLRNTIIKRQMLSGAEQNAIKKVFNNKNNLDNSSLLIKNNTTASLYKQYMNIPKPIGSIQKHSVILLAAREDFSKAKNYKAGSSASVPTYQSNNLIKIENTSNGRHLLPEVGQSTSKKVLNNQNSDAKHSTAFPNKLYRRNTEKTGSGKNHRAILVASKRDSSQIKNYNSYSSDLVTTYQSDNSSKIWNTRIGRQMLPKIEQNTMKIVNQSLPEESKKYDENFATPFSFKFYRNITEKTNSGQDNSIILVAAKNDLSKANSYKSERYQFLPKYQSGNFTKRNSTIEKQMSEVKQSTKTKFNQNLHDESQKSGENSTTVFSSKRNSNIREKTGSSKKYGIILVIVNEDSSKGKNYKFGSSELMPKYHSDNIMKTRNTTIEMQMPSKAEHNIAEKFIHSPTYKSKRSGENHKTESSYITYDRNVSGKTGTNQNHRDRFVTKNSSKIKNYKSDNSELIPTYRSGNSTKIWNKSHMLPAAEQSTTKKVFNNVNNVGYSKQLTENNTTAFACKHYRNINEKTSSDLNRNAIIVAAREASSGTRNYKSDNSELLPIYICKLHRNKESSVNSRSVNTISPFLNFTELQNSTTEEQLMSKLKQSTTEKVVNIEFIVDDSPLFIRHTLNIEAILKIVKRERNIQAKILKELALFLPVLLCDILLLWGCWILLRDILQTIEQPRSVSEIADDHTSPSTLDTDNTRSSDISFDVNTQEVSFQTRQESAKEKKSWFPPN